jgi:hypothetical protein
MEHRRAGADKRSHGGHSFRAKADAYDFLVVFGNIVGHMCVCTCMHACTKEVDWRLRIETKEHRNITFQVECGVWFVMDTFVLEFLCVAVLIRYQVQTGKGNSAWVWSAGLDSIQS